MWESYRIYQCGDTQELSPFLKGNPVNFYTQRIATEGSIWVCKGNVSSAFEMAKPGRIPSQYMHVNVLCKCMEVPEGLGVQTFDFFFWGGVT